MKDLVEFIAKNLVAKPEAVRVEVNKKEDRIHFVLYVDDNETGKVIGKKGKTAKSIRTLLTAVAAKNGLKIHIEIPNKKKRSESMEKDSNVLEG